MGKTARVQLHKQPNSFATVEHGATKGASIGENLYLNGVLVRVQDILNIYANPGNGNGGSTPSYPTTYWRLIQEIPPNIVRLAALTGAGFAYRRPDGIWQLRFSGRAVIPFAFGDASPVELYAPAEDSMLVLTRLVIDTPFDGVGAALALGDDTTPDLYMTATENDPATAAGYQVCPDAVLTAGAGVFLTITPGTGAAAGAGRAIVETIPLAEN